MNSALLLAAALSLVPGASPLAGSGLPATPVDPTRSGPVPTALQEAAPPLMDVFGASVSVNEDGAAVTAVAAPLASWLPSDSFFSNLRVQAEAGGAKDRWGGGLSLNLLSNIGRKLDLPAEVAQEAVKKCENKVSRKPRLVHPVEALIAELLELLPAGEPVPRSRGKDETLDGYGGRIVAAWRSYAATAEASVSAKGNFAADALVEALDTYRTSMGDCAEKGLWAARWTRVYDNGYFVRAKVAGHFFPHVTGPSVPVNGTLTEPTPRFTADYSASVSVAYFPNPIFGLWLTGGYARSRPTSQATDFPERLSAGLDAAWNVYPEDRQQDGFAPGIAVGGYVRVSRCLAAAGCGQNLTEYASPVPASRVQTYGGFVDVRVTSKLQLRLAVPVEHYRLAAPIADSDGKTDVWRVVPTLSLTVAAWSI